MFVIFILYWGLFLDFSSRQWTAGGSIGFSGLVLRCAAAAGLAFLRFVWLWAALRRLLRRLSWHPLISQYAAESSEESRFASLPPVDLMTHTPTYTALSASARQARSFYDALKLPPERAGPGSGSDGWSKRPKANCPLRSISTRKAHGRRRCGTVATRKPRWRYRPNLSPACSKIRGGRRMARTRTPGGGMKESSS